MSDNINRDDLLISTLAELERASNVVEKLSLFGSSSWVLIKNRIYERSHDYLGISKAVNSSFLSSMTVVLVLMTLWHYIREIFRFIPRDLFVGAGSGVMLFKGELLDSYLPQELSSQVGHPSDGTLYLLSANHVPTLWRQRVYLRNHSAIIYSFMIAPLRAVLGNFIWLFSFFNRKLRSIAEEISERLTEAEVCMPPREIIRLHSRFCAEYVLFRLFLFPLRIRRAYVVSAYSNSALCAVLRRMGVKIVEVQHGLIGPRHRGYNYATQSTLLPVPDTVAVYNTWWRDELVAAGYFGTHRVTISPRLKYQLAEKEVSPFDFPYIVLTGQGILAEQIVVFSVDFMMFGTPLHLVYVPHPNETDEYVSLIAERIGITHCFHVARNLQVTTERLIIDSVAHLSIFSSCHFDSIHYKGKTFVLDLLKDNLMHYYISRSPEMFVPVKSAADFIDFLTNDGIDLLAISRVHP
jgi:hypothetical protein